MNEGYDGPTVKFPNGWLNCPNFGLAVQDLFIPFKTPLDKKFNAVVPQTMRFNILSMKNLIKKNDIHLVVNLTVENNFYNPREFLGLNQLKLMKDKRQRFPNDDQIFKFNRYVQDMLDKFPKGRVGVHCIHGYNNTGFMIIAYLVTVQNMKLEMAVKLFADARPPGIYREEYIEELKSRYDPDVDIPVPDFPDWYAEIKKGKKSRHRDEACVMETRPHKEELRASSVLSHPLERANVITSTREMKEHPLPPSEINLFGKEDDQVQIPSFKIKDEPDEYPEEFFDEVAPVIAAPEVTDGLNAETQRAKRRKRKGPKIDINNIVYVEDKSEIIENRKLHEENERKTRLTVENEKAKLNERHEFIIQSDKIVEVNDEGLRGTLAKRIKAILKTSREGYVGPQYRQLTRKTLKEFLETKNDLFHTWITDGRRYMLYIRKMNELYFIDENDKYFAVTGISFPHYQDPSRQLSDTIFDGEFVIDRISDTYVNIYLISHVFAIEGNIVPDHDIFKRFGIIEAITLLPRSTIPTNVLSKEPFSIGIKKIMPLNQIDYVWNNLRKNLPHGMHGLVFYPLMSKAYSDVKTNYLFLWQPPDVKFVDFKAVKALDKTTRQMVLELYLEGSEKSYTKLENLEKYILDLYDESIVEARRGGDKKWHIIGFKIGRKVATSANDIKDIIEEMKHPLTFTDLLEKI